MKDLFADLGALIFAAGVFLLFRCIPMDSLPQFIAAVAVMLLGCTVFCAADPFFS